MMKRFLVFGLIILYSTVLFGANKAAAFTDFFKPKFLAVDDKQLYVVEGTTVLIYGLNDFKLKSKFGKPGEGPQEFLDMKGMGYVFVYPRKNDLAIASLGKISFFTKDGKYIKELKTPSQRASVFPFGDSKLLMGRLDVDEKTKFVGYAWIICDGQMNKLKEITKTPFMQNGSMTYPPKAIGCFVCDDKLVVPEPTGSLSLTIYDNNGNKSSSIRKQVPVIKMNQKYKDMIFNAFKNMPGVKENFEAVKQMIKFESEFPSMQYCVAGNNRIVVITFKENKDGYESFVYDPNGKFIKQLNVPMDYSDLYSPFLMTVKNYKLYQLIENEDTEAWELFVSDLK